MVTRQEYANAYIRWQEAELRPFETWDFQECLRLRAEWHRVRDLYLKQEKQNEV